MSDEGRGHAVFGTVMRATAKAGRRQEAYAMMGERLDTPGFRATYLLLPDDDENTIVAAVIFEDRETYSANAHDPATDEWYGRFRGLLEADPEWTDGEWLSYLTTR